MTNKNNAPHIIRPRVPCHALPPQPPPCTPNPLHNPHGTPPPAATPTYPLVPPVQSPPRRQQPSSPPATQLQRKGDRNYNEKGARINMQDSLNVMGPCMEATVRELNVRYRVLARQLHLSKYASDII